MGCSFHSLQTGYATSGNRHLVGSDLNAELAKSALTVLIGTNGVGKSTLLRTLAGFLPPLSGEILWNGQSVSGLSPRELARKVSVVLTTRPNTPMLSAGDVVSMGRIPYASMLYRETDEDRSRTTEAMQLTETVSFRHRPIGTLSDGERQRIFIAKALAQDTETILLDEPTAYLDFPSKIQMFRLLSDLAHKRNRSILVATHDVETALRFADRMWLLRANGITEGTPPELAHSGEITRYFSAHAIRFDEAQMRFDY